MSTTGYDDCRNWIQMPEMLAFMATLNAAPEDDHTRLAMVDWLKEHDKPILAELHALYAHDKHNDIALRMFAYTYQSALLEELGLSQQEFSNHRLVVSLEHGILKVSNTTNTNQLDDDDVAEIARLCKDHPLIQGLTLHRCDSVTDISPLAELTNLRDLNLIAAYDLTDLTPLSQLTELRELYLTSPHLTDLEPLSPLHNLQTLSISHNHELTDLTPLATLTSLQQLCIRECPGITSLVPLANMKHLKYLDAYQCPDIDNISPLAGLTELEFLDLCAGASQIADIGPLRNLTKLQSLHLGDCAQIADASPLHSLSDLSWLCLGAVTQIDEDQMRALCCSKLGSNVEHDVAITTPGGSQTTLAKLREHLGIIQADDGTWLDPARHINQAATPTRTVH